MEKEDPTSKKKNQVTRQVREDFPNSKPRINQGVEEGGLGIEQPGNKEEDWRAYRNLRIKRKKNVGIEKSTVI